MKTALMTIAIEDDNISKLTHDLMRDYAQKIGADFVIINRPSISQTKSELEIFQIYNKLNKYDRIIFVGNDVLIRKDCPNLFEMIPQDKIGVFNEGFFIDHLMDMQEIVKQCGVDLDKWERQYYDMNVFVVSRKHKFLFKYPEMDVHACSITSFLNLRIIQEKLEVFELTYKFNRIPAMDEATGEHRLSSYIVNYSAVPKNMKESCLLKDIEDWKQKAPDFDYKRNILIKVHGGLGDQICAEPVVRFIAEQAYPNSNIVVKTWFPRLFSHLPVNVVNINDATPNAGTSYYLMETLVPPEHPSWKFISANLMHGTDFMSQLCLRQILPDNDKQIKLTYSLEDVAEAVEVFGIRPLSELVLVHPGKGWDSKSFPKEYWNEIIAGLVKDGHQVAIIGKHLSDEQGTIDIDIPEGAIDARNLLGLGGLIATISQAKILISNDSAPVHIAGAFDNYIVLIPTCKHPDHVLPIRNGDRKYKTAALYKKLICTMADSTPTQIHGKTIDKVPGNIKDYLPDAEEVIKLVKKYADK